MLRRINFLVAMLGLFLIAGCGAPKNEQTNEPEVKTEEPKKEEAPPILGEEDNKEGGAMEVMFDPDKVGEGVREATYAVDMNVVTGTLSGVSRIVGWKGRSRNPAKAQPIKFEGKNAIKESMEGEEKYYTNIRVKENKYTYERWTPTSVVIFIRELKAGRLGKLSRPVMMAKKGYLQSNNRSNIAVCPTGELLQLGTWDKYPSDFAVTNPKTGKELFTGKVIYKDDWKPGQWLHAAPSFILSKPFNEPGVYEVTDKRHPWQKGYIFVTDNPYVTVARGKFSIGAIPVGKHELEVWHPVFEPVKKTIPIEIKKNETTEIFVDLKIPENLQAQYQEKKK